MATTAPDGDRAHGTCLNCETVLTGEHCHGCGQPAHIHRSVKGIGHDLMHGVLHLDGKLAYTLPLLALKPGQLTRRYIAGERRRFVSPMGMFLFSVTILFLTIQLLGVHLIDIGEENLAGSALARAEQSLSKVAVEVPTTANADPEAGGLGLTVDTEGDDKVLIGRKLVEDDAAKSAGSAERLTRVERARAALPLVREARGLWSKGDGTADLQDTSSTSFGSAVVNKIRTDPGLLLYKVQANSYKFSWALIPLSVPFVWLLFFWRRDLGLYDHTVFVTYSIASMTLLTVTLMVLSKVGVPSRVLGVALCVLAPVHIWVHLRGSYLLSKRATFVRFALLSVFIWFAVALFAVILFALGALG